MAVLGVPELPLAVDLYVGLDQEVTGLDREVAVLCPDAPVTRINARFRSYSLRST